MYERLLGFISENWINQLKNPRTSCTNIKQHIYMEDLMKTELKWKLIGPYYGSKILLHGFVSRGIVFSSKPQTDSLPPSFYITETCWSSVCWRCINYWNWENRIDINLRKKHHMLRRSSAPQKHAKLAHPAKVLEITTKSLVLRMIASVSNQHLPHSTFPLQIWNPNIA